jgi:hypothetical protein
MGFLWVTWDQRKGVGTKRKWVVLEECRRAIVTVHEADAKYKNDNNSSDEHKYRINKNCMRPK